VADAFGRRLGDITALVLERPRHEDLIDEIRASGARIKLIPDGDITAAISAAIRGTNDHLAVGIGGAFEGIIAAAALSCLGGEIQGQLWPMSRTEINQAREHGIEDVGRIFGIEDLVRGHQIVVATGISNGDLLRGVRYFADGARTHSTVLCSRCNRVRFIDSIHLFRRDRHEEIRL
jgi:fructose-1,6-bisphosphatase II